MSQKPQVGDEANLIRTVTAADTASTVGSGDLEVLGTPVLLAWCEAATCEALDLDDPFTSVGVKAEIEHLAANAIGDSISATATVASVDRRAVSFDVVAVDGRGRAVGRGRIVRMIVDRQKFLARLQH